MIGNLLNANDWKIKNFLMLVLAFQLAILILTCLNFLGFDVPLVTQVAGFVYLIYIPGVIILRILKLHKLGSVRTVLYTVGLSISFNMFLGFIINLIYPKLGILQPISILPLIITWTIILSLLCLLAYIRDRAFFTDSVLKIRELFNPIALVLLLLPLFAILGSQLVNYYQNNIVLVLFPVLFMFKRVIPERLYPLAIYCVSLALLWHCSLISEYLTQFDSFIEYQYYNLVAETGLWNWEIYHIYNTMLSITIFPAVLSQMMDISGTLIFKLIYPILYALMPLGLYSIYREHYNGVKPVLAVFLVTAIYVFFLDLHAIGRQMIAELFYVLLLMLIASKSRLNNSRFLFIIFGAGLIVSHHSLSYLFIGFLLICMVILYLYRKEKSFITLNYIILFIVACLAWYMYMSASSPLVSLSYIARRIYENFSLEFLNPFSRDTLSLLSIASPNALYTIYRVLWYLILFFMAVGVIELIRRFIRKTVNEYDTIATGNYLLLAAAVAIPFFSNALGVDRIVHITSLVLAPFCIVGMEITFNALSRVIQSVRQAASYKPLNSCIIVVVILILFFIFNTRLPFEFANSADGRSIPLAYSHVIRGDDNISTRDTITIRGASLTTQEVVSANWLRIHRNSERSVYATYWQIGVPALMSYGMIPPENLKNVNPFTPVDELKMSYIYLGYTNVKLGYGTTRYLLGQPDPEMGDEYYYEISQLTSLFNNAVKLYSDGASDIYWLPK